MSAVKLLATFAENKIGQLARTTRVLADLGVNILWVTISSTESFGVIKLLVDKHNLAYEALRQHGISVSQIEVIAIEVEDRPGGLNLVVECLAGEGVNVENASGFVSQRRAVLLIEAEDVERCRRLLRKANLRLVSAEELVAI
jgi:hypothetical protein